MIKHETPEENAMVKPVIRDVLFLGQRSETATEKDIYIGQNLLDTLQANRERCVGKAANMSEVSPAPVALA